MVTDKDAVVALTQGMSGDDLKDVARRASRAARRARKPLAMEHLLSALPHRVPVPPDRLRANSFHESGHVVVAHEFGRVIQEVMLADTVLQSTRSRQLLGTVSIEAPPFSMQTSDGCLEEVAILLGGMAAEREVFGSHDEGVGGSESSDLVKATYLATLAVACFGMGRTLVSERYLSSAEAAQLRRINPVIWRETDEVLRGQLERATEIVRRKRRDLERVAEKLLAERRLAGGDIRQLLSSTSIPDSARTAH